MNKKFSTRAWADYQHLLENDKRILSRLNKIIIDIERNGHKGIGKPEPLKGDLSGYWSRRVTDEHRIVYRIEKDTIIIVKCMGHYN